MPDGSNITPFPTREPEFARVDVSACLNGYRVWVLGRRFADFATLSNAARCGAALTTLDALGLLDCVRSPEDVLRAGLSASLASEDMSARAPSASSEGL